MNQRIPRHSQQVDDAVQLPQRGIAPHSHASLSEQYDGWMSGVSHPDLSVLRELVKSSVSQSTTASEIENQVFSMFKETEDFRILKNEMQDTIGELECLFVDGSTRASHINRRLNLIMQRATITTDQSPADFGNQKANVVQLTCLRLKQLAALARQLRHSPPHGVNVQDYIEHLKDCVKNIAADAEVCGPGVVQKVEDEFACLKLRLFPPSVELAITQTQDRLAKQIIIDFCNQTYINTNQVQIGNQIHYVAAWQDRLIDSDPDFAHLPKNNDPFAPVLHNNVQNTELQKTLKQQISTGATVVNACRFLAESAFQDIHGHMGGNAADIGKNYAAFTEVLRQIQTRFPGLSEHHLLESDDLYNFKLRGEPNHATLFFLRNLPGNRFNPETVLESDGLKFKQFGELLWTESIDSDTGETQVAFDMSANLLFNGLRANDPRSTERIVQLLPFIGNVLFKTNPSERVRFLAELLQRGFGCNPISSMQFLPAGLGSATDASNFLAAWLYNLPNSTMDQSLANKGYSVESLLEWHNNSNSIKNYFTNSDLIIDGLIDRVLSNNNVRDVIAFVPKLSNPFLAYRVLVASKARSVSNQRVPAWLRSSQWTQEVSRMKNLAKQQSNYSTYLVLKASESNRVGHGLKSLKPQRLQNIIRSGKLDCLKFALKHGANPNTTFISDDESSLSFRSRVSALQACIECNDLEMARSLLSKGAAQDVVFFFNGRNYDAATYAQELGRNEIAALLLNF